MPTGPVSGIAVCLIKNLIKLPSTSTAAVGELFNFVMGALFVGVAGFVYKRSKTRRSALIGAGLGALITTNCYVDIAKIAREVVRGIGYDRAKFGFDCDTCGIITNIDEQSADIALGVDKSLEDKEEGDSQLDNGAGDQGMMFGYACDETPELMPLPISLAQKMARRLTQVRKDGTVPFFRPDGKTQVSVAYDENDRPVRVDTVVISTQHSPEVSLDQIRKDMIELVIRPTVPAELMDENTKIYVNPTGRFVIGRPPGGHRPHRPEDHRGHLRRLLHHGGGAFSGKDPSKVDRSGAYAARWVAKNVVAAGLARRCQLELAYAIGVAQPVSILVETFGTGTVADEVLEQAVRKTFDLRPTAIIRDLDPPKKSWQNSAMIR